MRHPPNPKIGEMYYNTSMCCPMVYNGTSWHTVENLYDEKKTYGPTKGELDSHPSLKSAWDDYLTIRKLLGLDN